MHRRIDDGESQSRRERARENAAATAAAGTTNVELVAGGRAGGINARLSRGCVQAAVHDCQSSSCSAPDVCTARTALPRELRSTEIVVVVVVVVIQLH